MVYLGCTGGQPHRTNTTETTHSTHRTDIVTTSDKVPELRCWFSYNHSGAYLHASAAPQ